MCFSKYELDIVDISVILIYECYGQAEKTHADSILQTENKIVKFQKKK